MTAAEHQPAPRRRFRRFAIMAILPLALAGGGVWMWLNGGRYEETENANLRLSRVAVSSEVAGRVLRAHVHENGMVAAGDVLFELDPEPFRIALAQADAAIEGARLNVLQFRAAYQQALAQQQVLEDEAEFAAGNLARAKSLAAKGVAAATSVDNLRHAQDKAEEQLAAARQGVAAARAALGDRVDGPTDGHPLVAAALAARDKAAWSLAAATVRAPAAGMVYQSTAFQPGLYVSAGASLFAIVETTTPWVDANFKETQLAHVEPGQPADIVFDLAPGRVFKGRVESIGAGTGAEFSLLPAQNATGNWVKVTQRIPVRVTLDDAASATLLRSGMSATVTVDTGRSRSFSDLLGRAEAAQ